MKNFKLLNDTFIHLSNGNKGYSTHGKESKYIKWIHEGEGKQQLTFNNLTPGDETFYVDRFIPAGLQDNVSKKKYAILLECCWIPGNGSWIREPQIYPKNKLVSIIASNKSHLPGHQQRMHMLEQLKDYAPLFGRGFNEVEYKEEALADYMFSVAIENADDWFTEKILDCFLTGTVPIYYGTPSITKWFNPDGIVFLEDGFDIEELDEDLYKSMESAIKDNFERAMKMEMLEDFIWETYFEIG